VSRQRGSAEPGKIDVEHEMLLDPERRRDSARRIHFVLMVLTVSKRQREELVRPLT
jgi:hypothetical protein